MISVILVEPGNAGNIGAVARCMKNFGCSDLVLVNPKADHLSEEAINRAKHAGDVLRNAKTAKTLASAIKGYDIIAATTSKLGTDYNIPRLPMSPEELARNTRSKDNLALVFGREGDGLFNHEIQKCSFILSIPSSLKYPALNLSHAVAIVLYELFKAHGADRIGENIAIATAREKKEILKKIDAILDSMDFATPEKKRTQKEVWKNIVNKNFLTKREAFALMGFLRKMV